MWTLPLHKGITIRRIEKPLRSLVERAGGWVREIDLSRSPWRWDGDRLSVVVGPLINVPRDWRITRDQTEKLYNTLTDKYVPAAVRTLRREGGWSATSHESYVQDALAPGEVFVDRGNVPTVYVHQLWDNDRMRDELEVARDTILEAPLEVVPPHAYAIARELLPIAHGLFVALIRKERQILRGEAWA